MLPIKKEKIEVSIIETKPYLIKIPSFKIPVHYLKMTGIFVLSCLLFVVLTSVYSPEVTTYKCPESSDNIMDVCNIEQPVKFFGVVDNPKIKENKDISLEIRARAIELLKDWDPATRTFYRKGKGNSFGKQENRVVITKDSMMKYVPDFLVEEVLTNVPCLASITAAQTDLESNWFQSNLARNTNNGYGIKYVKKWDKDEDTWMAQYREGHVIAHDDIPTDKFIKFKTKWACIRFHTKFLTLLHYKKHIGKDYKGWANGLRTSGYATDKRYTNALLEKYKTLDLAVIDAIGYKLRKEFTHED